MVPIIPPLRTNCNEALERVGMGGPEWMWQGGGRGEMVQTYIASMQQLKGTLKKAITALLSSCVRRRPSNATRLASLNGVRDRSIFWIESSFGQHGMLASYPLCTHASQLFYFSTLGHYPLWLWSNARTYVYILTKSTLLNILLYLIYNSYIQFDDVVEKINFTK